MRVLAILLMSMLLGLSAGCKEKPEGNQVDLDQIDIDNSNNYRYIFRDAIQEQEKRDKKYSKKHF